LLLFASSRPLLDLLRIASTAIATLNFLVWLSVNISLTLTPKLSLLPQNTNRPTASSSLIGRQWSIWVMHILLRSRCPGLWFYAITHAARMMNAIPGKHSGYLTSPFLPVHGVGHNKQTWFFLFSLRYFHHVCDGNQKCSKHQAHTMDGILIGRSPTSNALLMYNPQNKQYYDSDSYCLDSYRLPTLVYPDIKYNSGLFCSLFATIIPPWKRNTRLALALNG
jgi:hypothetical protein